MTKTAEEYGRALFLLAEEEGNEDAVQDELNEISEILRRHPDYLRLLASAAIPKKERIAMLRQAFGCLFPVRIISFLSLLIEQGAAKEIRDCIRQYTRCMQKSRGITEAYVTSALPLTKKESGILKKKLEQMCGQKVELKCKVDASLLGGLIAELSGKRYDGSLRGSLRKLKEMKG